MLSLSSLVQLFSGCAGVTCAMYEAWTGAFGARSPGVQRVPRPASRSQPGLVGAARRGDGSAFAHPKSVPESAGPGRCGANVCLSERVVQESAWPGASCKDIAKGEVDLSRS